MAIESYKDEHSGTTLYRVKVSVRSSAIPSLRLRRFESGIKSHAEAKSLEKNFKMQLLREIVQREQIGCSWGKLVEEWGAALQTGRTLDKPVSLTTALDNIRALELYTTEWWRRAARDITRAEVRQVLDVLDQQGRSKSRKRAVKNAINGCFIWGIENGWIKGVSQSPAAGIKIGREEEKKPEILTLGEVKKLLDAARMYNHPWYPMWATALYTGMRSGELHALLWTDVDFENRRITVAKSYNGRFKKVTPTKGRYWREAPITSDLEALLIELRATAKGRPHVLPRMVDWDRGEQARVLREFCTGIGIPSVKFHALRACFATLLLREKVAPVVVMKVCGWKDLKTMQRYIRLAGIEIEGATDGLKLIQPREAVAEVVELLRR
ncbi:MAG: hypothetical protein RJB38_579 [Pseudomonadota bacterium]|jgi:integrase